MHQCPAKRNKNLYYRLNGEKERVNFKRGIKKFDGKVEKKRAQGLIARNS